MLLDFLNGTAYVFLCRSSDTSAKDTDYDIGIVEKLTIDYALRVCPELWVAVGFPFHRKQDEVACRCVRIIPTMNFLSDNSPLQNNVPRGGDHDL